MIKIKFCGAAGMVTGSHYVVTTPFAKFAVDAGMFQGFEHEHLNLEPFAYDVSELDFLLLTHAHIDHSGLIPKLIKEGFSGPIYATDGTIKITNELLLDSARIQELNYERGDNFGKFTGVRAILYGTSDVENAMSYFRRVTFDEPFSPVEGVVINYKVAGHILGAASIEITVGDLEKRKIVFSGDIGRVKSPIIDTFDFNYRTDADVVLMESLYGGEYHPDRDETAREFIKAITGTIKSGGSVFIPSFAVERTQEILNDIRTAKDLGELDNSIKVYLDSPLAQRVTAIYSNSLDNQISSKFSFDNLIHIRKIKDSRLLTSRKGVVVIAGSGMADGGRIVSHLTKALLNKKNSVIFVGFQAENTAGREIVDGAKTVMLDKNLVDVKARIYHFKGFSAHGDTNDYITWLERFGSRNKKVFLVHAEEDRSESMKNILNEIGYENVFIPKIGEEYVI